jgi:type II secretory pathway pseudopilin PulG
MSVRRRAAAGLTLVEVLISTLIVSLVIVSASWAMSAATTARHLRAEEPATAALLARELHELAVGLPTEPSGEPPAATFAGITALDTLDGARFAPPLLATGEAAPGVPLWEQEAAVSVYDVADTSLPVSPRYEPIDPGSGRIYRLTVHMSRRGADMGTWWWWIDP